MRFVEFKNNQPNLMQAFEDFFPIVMKELKINKLPKIKLEKMVDDIDQPTFGRFVNDTEIIHIGIANRHPIDILRTLAHELVHYKQFISNRLPDNAGHTGSPQENEAHIIAGIVMRHFNKAHPQYFKDRPLELDV